MKGSVLLTVVVAVFSYIIANILMSFGVNRRAYNHVPGECISLGLFSKVSGFATHFDGKLFVADGKDEANRTNVGRLMTYNADNNSAWELPIFGSNLKVNPGGISTISLSCSPSSIWADIDGSLIVTCHPSRLRYYSYASNPKEYFAPSLVVRIKEDENGSSLTQLYSNDGATVSASKAAVRTGNKILIAGREGVLSCALPISS
uniref:Bulb-type lectin domain-containing protein n=1 Tax=Heterorhabditis bacteriophora TaxID=37862 RepID=A0A1I7XU90_HETBA